jgi:hypothetical protein
MMKSKYFNSTFTITKELRTKPAQASGALAPSPKLRNGCLRALIIEYIVGVLGAIGLVVGNSANGISR